MDFSVVMEIFHTSALLNTVASNYVWLVSS